MSISAKEEILSIANKVIPGVWTTGFIKNPIQNIVYWNEIGENIMPDLWAEGIFFSISIYSFLKAKHCKRIITYLTKDIEDQSLCPHTFLIMELEDISCI